MSIEFAKVTLTTAGTNSRSVTAQLRLNGAEGADDDAEPADSCEVLHPLGVISRPVLTANTEAAYFRMGDEIVVIGILDKGAATLNPATGELWLYCPADATAVQKFKANGDISIDAKSGQTIYLNVGGTGGAAVGRVGDQVQVTLSAVAIGQITAPGGGGPCTGGPITLTGSITAGAPAIKA